MDEVEPKEETPPVVVFNRTVLMSRKAIQYFTAAMAAVGIGMIIGFTALATASSRADKRVEDRDAQNLALNARIMQLNKLLMAQTDVTACVRILSVQRDRLRDVKDGTIDQAIVTALEHGDVNTVLAPLNQQLIDWRNAQAQYEHYVIEPELPCPVDIPDTTPNTTAPPTTTPGG